MVARLRAVIFSVIGSALLFASAQANPISAKAGYFQNTEWDFKIDGPLELAGEWQVIWGQLISPTDFDQNYQGDLVALPSRWNDVDHPLMDGPFGSATFRMKLKLPDYNRQLAFHTIAAHSAYRVFIDGVIVAENGQVGSGPDTFVANYVSRVFPGQSGNVEIVYQVSNFSHAYGGPGHPLTLWDAQDLGQHLEFMSIMYALILGVILMIGIFHMILFVADRSDLQSAAVHFWFSLLCAVIVFRIQGIIPYLHIYFPELAYWRDLRFVYASLYAAPAAYLLFFRNLFPEEFPRRSTHVVVALSVGFLGFVLVTPEPLFTQTRNLAIGLNLFAILFSLVLSVRAVARKRVGARVVVTTNLIFLTTAINDAVIYTDNARGFDLTPFGIMVLGLGYSFALLLTLQLRFRESRDTSARLAVLNVDLDNKVKERTAAFEDAAARAEHHAAERANFIAAASHDFRQPLHALALFNAALVRRNKDDQLGDLIVKQEQAIVHLGEMLKDSLDATRLNVEQGTPKCELVQVDELFASLEATFQTVAAEKGVALTFDTQTKAIVTDAHMLVRILSNLIDNGLRVAKENLALNIDSAGECWEITVADDGPGIDEDKLGGLFKSYTQLMPGDASSGGYGLGLFVVHEFVTALGGDVSAKAASPTGAVFRIVLPKGGGGGAPQQTARYDRGVKDIAPGRHILIVDDDPQILSGMASLLREWGQGVTVAHDGASAMDAIREGVSPDIIIMDYHLAREDGVSVLKTIREALNISVPVIFVTGATDKSIVTVLEDQGGLVLHKPVEPKALQSAIGRLDVIVEQTDA